MKTDVSQLGYLGVSVADPASWEQFATRILGLELVGEGADGAKFFRMDENDHRLAVHEGADDDVAYVGWQVADLAALKEMARRLEAVGAEVEWGSTELASLRKVGSLLVTRDPSGVRNEVYCEALIRNERPFRSPRGVRRFEAGALGLGHVVLCVDDYDATLRFYRDGLGLKTSDYIEMDLGGGGELTAAFLHAGPRHHSLAILPMKSPRRLHHLMLQVADIDDVGTTYDLCRTAGVPVARSLGRHTNDQMLSFYMVSPSGFEVEYGYGGLLIDDDSWTVQRHRSPSIWGHQPPPRGA